MKEISKILLSKNEISVLKEEAFFLYKKNITKKIFHQLAECVSAIQSTTSFQKISFPKGTDVARGKITKGENYLDLPFIILDFPRMFSGDKIFVFRTMIWWGKHVSCTLLISGNEAFAAKEILLKNYSEFKKKEIFVCINESPWLHHFGEENFLPLKSLDKEKANLIFLNQKFLKLSRKIPVNKINKIKDFAAESFQILSKLML